MLSCLSRSKEPSTLSQHSRGPPVAIATAVASAPWSLSDSSWAALLLVRPCGGLRRLAPRPSPALPLCVSILAPPAALSPLPPLPVPGVPTALPPALCQPLGDSASGLTAFLPAETPGVLLTLACRALPSRDLDGLAPPLPAPLAADGRPGSCLTAEISPDPCDWGSRLASLSASASGSTGASSPAPSQWETLCPCYVQTLIQSSHSTALLRSCPEDGLSPGASSVCSAQLSCSWGPLCQSEDAVPLCSPVPCTDLTG